MAQKPLTQPELELLSAYVDDELSKAEQAQHAALLKREDALEYVRQLQRTRGLVAEHAAVPAPQSVAEAVAASVRKAAPVHQLPVMSWRPAVFAVAAALLVAVGVMFGPMLLGPEPIAPTGIARETLELPDSQVEKDLHRAELQEGAHTAMDGEMERVGNAEPAAEVADVGSVEKARRNDSPRADAAESEDSRRYSGRGSEAGLGGAPGGAPAPSSGEAERKAEARQSGAADEADRGAMPMRRARGGPPAAEQPAQPAPHILLELKTDRVLAAQADALWVAALHGKARLVPDQQATDIHVELPEDAVPELRRALQQLVSDQGFGKFEPALAEAKRDQKAGVDGYLPADKQADADAPEVRVVIRIR